MEADARPVQEGRTAAAGRRYWIVWGTIFATVFALLVLSSLRFLTQDHLVARHLDAERTTLTPLGGGLARLHLVVLHVAEDGQLKHQLLKRSDGVYLVEIDWTADTRPSGIRGHGGERVIEVRLPETETVLVLDRRWARDEALEVRLARDAP